MLHNQFARSVCDFIQLGSSSAVCAWRSAVWVYGRRQAGSRKIDPVQERRSVEQFAMYLVAEINRKKTNHKKMVNMVHCKQCSEDAQQLPHTPTGPEQFNTVSRPAEKCALTRSNGPPQTIVCIPDHKGMKSHSQGKDAGRNRCQWFADFSEHEYSSSYQEICLSQ